MTWLIEVDAGDKDFLMVFRQGRLIATQLGAAPAAVLRPWLDDALSNRSVT